jgi:hypothetical protein
LIRARDEMRYQGGFGRPFCLCRPDSSVATDIGLVILGAAARQAKLDGRAFQGPADIRNVRAQPRCYYAVGTAGLFLAGGAPSG